VSTVRLLELPHIDEVDNGPALDSALVKIGAFLAEKRLTGVFGVRKLHRHFLVDDDEVVLSILDASEQIIRTSVVALNQVGASQACQWGFFPDGGSVVLGWSAEAKGTPEIEADLLCIGAFLSREGLTGILAVELVDCGLRTDPSIVFLEDTNEDARTQWSRPVSVSEVDGYPAGWRFSVTGERIDAWWCNADGRSH